jgi:hypothetical protein
MSIDSTSILRNRTSGSGTSACAAPSTAQLTPCGAACWRKAASRGRTVLVKRSAHWALRPARARCLERDCPPDARQPVHLAPDRAQFLLGSEEAQGINLPPDHVVNPRHHRDLLPPRRHHVSPDSHPPRQASASQTGQATARRGRNCPCSARPSACGTPRHLLNPTGPHNLAQPDPSTSSGRPLRVTVPVQQPASLTFAALVFYPLQRISSAYERREH